MADPRDRLVRCFSAVFPQMSEPDILRSSVDSTDRWDSLATVSLFAVVEEEFGIEIKIEDIEYLLSFNAFLNYVSIDTAVS